jgi:DeoR/GlpR family transcriptional regulator of sugar metabolism
MLMYLAPRHTEIIELAKTEGRVLVDDLAQRFDVTPQTIRKDLNDLCERQLLTRIHGGASSRRARRTWSMRSAARLPRRKSRRSGPQRQR